MNSQCIAEIAKRYTALDDSIRKGRLDLPTALSRYAHVTKQGNLAVDRLGSANLHEATEIGSHGKPKYIPWTISVEGVDRDGDIVVSRGCRLENYAKNPIVFFGHQEWPVPVGTSRREDGSVAVYPGNGVVKAWWYPDYPDPDSDFIAGKVLRGILSASSCAFVPLQAIRLDGVEKARTRTNPMTPPGWRFDSWDLTEWSVVGVPSNSGAIRDSLDKEKSFISPRLQKSLGPYAAQPRGRCFSGWCHCPPPEEKSMTAKRKAAAKKACCDDCRKGKACGCGKGNPAVKEKYITHNGDSWKVHAESGKVLGTHDTEADAKRQLRAVEANKHKGRPRTKSTQAQMEGPGQQPGGRTRQQVPTPPAQTHSDPVKCKCSKCKSVRKCPCGKGCACSVAKAMGESSGAAGGYIIPPEQDHEDKGKVEEDGGKGKELTDTDGKGKTACFTCSAHPGSCAMCGGTGISRSDIDCPACDGSGECPDCDGSGFKKTTPLETNKSVNKTGRDDSGRFSSEGSGEEANRKRECPKCGASVVPSGSSESGRHCPKCGASLKKSFQKQVPPDLPPSQDGRAQYGQQTQGGGGMAGSAPMGGIPSLPQVYASLHTHARAEADYLDQLPQGHKAALATYRSGHVDNRMDHLRGEFTRRFPEDDLEKMCKALETDAHSQGGPSTDPGEAGLVDLGRIPPSESENDMARRKTMDNPEHARTITSPGAGNNRSTVGAGTTSAPYNKTKDDDPNEAAGAEAPPEAPADMGETCACGEELPPGANFCPSCGQPALGAEPEVPPGGMGAEPMPDTMPPPPETGVDVNAPPGMGTPPPAMTPPADPAPPGTDMNEPDEQEIMERYRFPKSAKWVTSKYLLPTSVVKSLEEHGFLRTAANGTKYLMLRKGLELEQEDEGAAPYNKGLALNEEDEGAAPYNSKRAKFARYVAATKDFLDDMAGDAAVPKNYQGAAGYHSGNLGQVHKALTDAGKEQKTGGKGSALSNEGHVERNGGKGQALSEEGSLQANKPGSGKHTFEGGTGPTEYNKQVSRATQQRLDRINASFARLVGKPNQN